MSVLAHVPPGRYRISARTLNRLIDAANLVNNLVVEDVTADANVDGDPGARSKLIPAAGQSILRIVHPPGSTGVSLPDGGIENDILVKQSSTDGDAAWESPGSALNWRNLTAAITVAGIIPTATEISTALAAAYSATTPADGDRIILTVSSVPKFFAYVGTASLTASGLFLRSFVVSSVTYYATVHQCGLY